MTDIIARCEARGLRMTDQRRILARVIGESEDHPDVEELYARASAVDPRISLATVYRTVKGLVEEGWLAPIDIPGQPTCYEAANLEHHHHFHCRACGRVYDVDGCAGKVLSIGPPGFTVEDHEVILYGRCLACTA